LAAEGPAGNSWLRKPGSGPCPPRVIVTHPRDFLRHAAMLLPGVIGCLLIDNPSVVDPYRDLMYHFTRARLRHHESGEERGWDGVGRPWANC